jgi:hypothetical protein
VVEELNDLGTGRGLAELGEDAPEAVLVGVGVGHRVGGEHDVVAVVVGGACGGLDAGAGGDAGWRLPRFCAVYTGPEPG